MTEQSLKAYGVVLSIGSSRTSVMSTLANSIMGWLPLPVRNVIGKWNSSSASEFPGLGAWVGKIRMALESKILVVFLKEKKFQVAQKKPHTRGVRARERENSFVRFVEECLRQ